MSSSFLTKGGESICVIKQGSQPPLLYRLEKREEYGFQFYGIFHRFELDTNKPLSHYPYGHLSTCIDPSGIRLRKKVATLKKPVYSLFKKKLEGYLPEKQDLPYACISTSALATSSAGDDFYLNTLFLMTTGYGILTKISAVAGRDQDDCCSPEFYYEAYKVQLKTNPLKQIQDVVPEATIVEYEVSSSPGIVNPIKVKFNDSKTINNLDGLIDSLFLTLKREV